MNKNDSDQDLEMVEVFEKSCEKIAQALIGLKNLSKKPLNIKILEVGNGTTESY